VALALQAANCAATITQGLTLTIDEPRSITSAAAATFTVGSPGDFTITPGHDHPAATTLSIPAASLPSGVAFKDNGDGSATISGTPAAGSGGDHSFDVTSNFASTATATREL
jgi:large repetitive protein